MAKVSRPIAVVICAVSVGTAGYALIENLGTFEALYMTVITLATVGYGEVYGLSPEGRAFTMLLITVSVGVVGYSFHAVTSLVVEGHLSGMVQQTRTLKAISKLRGHIIICGAGRMGAAAALELAGLGTRCVVIDLADTDKWDDHDNVHFLQDDATRECALMAAGIEHAAGVVCAMGDDARNVMTTVVAKSLAPDVTVLARGHEEGCEKVLTHAGADESISPYVIGGRRMALGVLHPELVGFWEAVVRESALNMRMGSAGISTGSSWEGRAIRDIPELLQADVMILGVKPPTGEVIVNPPKTTRLETDCLLVVLGSEDQIESVMDLVASSMRQDSQVDR